MDKNEQLKNILSSIQDLPEFLKQENQISRLYYLLYGKDKDYEGPLYNGLQENEWSMISLLIANWVMEVFHQVKPKELKRNVNNKNLTIIASTILIALIKNKIIPLPEGKEDIVISILENTDVLNFVNNQLELILNKIQYYCCGIIPPSKKSIMQITNETGNKCTLINSIKSLQLM